MPDDCSGFPYMRNTCLVYGEVVDALGIEMNLAMLFRREALQQFGQRALRSMTAVNEG